MFLCDEAFYYEMIIEVSERKSFRVITVLRKHLFIHRAPEKMRLRYIR